ncbi:MAG: hypothetical protein DMG85_20125 [Acidobacteria bacterium]|nr:MAG: hypothetical protein DMG85_20125 [Acidobacteriota bacterium]
MLDRVKKPAATDRVARLGNGNALIEWSCPGKRSRKREIAGHPAISDLIVEDKPVAIVEARTGCAYQSKEKRVVRRPIRAIERVAIFIENLDRAIDRLHVMAGADVAVGVGRQTHTAALGRVHPIKGQQRRRHLRQRRQDLLHQRLEPFVGRGWFGWSWNFRVRIARQPLLFELMAWRNVREVAQIRV